MSRGGEEGGVRWEDRAESKSEGSGERKLRVEEMHGLLMTWVHRYVGSGRQVITFQPVTWRLNQSINGETLQLVNQFRL